MEEEKKVPSSTNIDEEKLKIIIKNIIELERQNVKTKDKNDNEMVKAIRKIIEEELQCF